MFYCEECQKITLWPKSLSRSLGPCEMCDKQALCYETQTMQLPVIDADLYDERGYPIEEGKAPSQADEAIPQRHPTK